VSARRKTARDILGQKGSKNRIVAITAYDTPTARLVDAAEVDIVLVGDSVGNVVLGYENTLPVTMDEMIHHCRAVMRASPRALVVADMPYLSFQVSVERAVENAGRLIKEGGVDAVKLERGRFADAARAMVDASIPVMGHVGLAPQSFLHYGGFRVQGRSDDGAKMILDEARAFEAAGCFSLVLEGMPRDLAAMITDEVKIPTIGIGAGVACDGQIQVFHDLFGLDPSFSPKHARVYANLAEVIVKGVTRYRDDVRGGDFPSEEESFGD
jgi:3-methyl-2-oxobutanoate hydroxymethyltransferase